MANSPLPHRYTIHKGSFCFSIGQIAPFSHNVIVIEHVVIERINTTKIAAPQNSEAVL
jgi:hypothetical protein